jgi:hypothetical protein
MTDRELELQLRDYFRSEVDDDLASGDLLARVSAIPAGTPILVRQGRRGWLLAAAVLLLLALLWMAVAVGSGTLRFPTNRLLAEVSPSPSAPSYPLPETVATALSPSGCDPSLPDGVSAMVWSSDAIAGQLSSLSALWAFDDGLVVVASVGSTPDAPWAQRQLSQPGLRALIAGLMPSPLLSCRSYVVGPSSPAQLSVTVRGSTSPSTFFTVPVSDVYSPAVTTPAQSAAARAVVNAVKDPDLGLGAGAWTESWRAYESATWHIQVDMTYGPGAELTDAVVLPDGTPLLQAGADDPTAAERNVDGGSARCAIVDKATALAVIAQMPGPGDPPGNWDFSNATVTIGPVLPGDSCPTHAGLTPTPPPPATAAPSGTGPCDYLTGAAIQDALGDPGLATFVHAESEAFQGWTSCFYYSDYRTGQGFTGTDTRQGILLVRGEAVSAAEAPEVAAELYGPKAISAMDIGGHQVFYNGCAPETDEYGCAPSLAIAADPDFIVITWMGSTKADLVTLATTLVQKLDGG